MNTSTLIKEKTFLLHNFRLRQVSSKDIHMFASYAAVSCFSLTAILVFFN